MIKGPRLFLFLLVAVSTVFGNKILPHEPISVVKSLQGVQDASSPWSVLSGSMNEGEVFGVFDQLEKRIKPFIANNIVIAIHKGHVVLDHLPKAVDSTYNVTVPHANLLSLIAASLPVLFKDKDSQFLIIPVKEIFAESDVVIPKSFHSKNLAQLLNTVSKIGRDSVGFLNELNLQGRVTVQTVNAIIGEKIKRAAWNNALSYLGLDGGGVTDSHHIVAPLEDFYILLETLLSSFKSATTYPDMSLPYQHPDHYTFGWWLNCNLKGACLYQDMPEDVVFSASPNMRLYVSESFDLTLAVIHTTQLSVNMQSFNKLLEADNKIWSELRQLITQHDGDAKREEKKNGQEEPPTREESKDERQQSDQAGDSDDLEREEKKEADHPPEQDHPEQEKGEEEQREDNTNIEPDNSQTPRSSPFLEPLYMVLRQVKYYFSLYLEYTGRQHWLVRGLLWVLFVMVAHVVVYYGLHWFWFILKTIVPWTKQPKTKTGYKARLVTV